ncbi:MAG: hypothetical protein DRR06_16610 [Gammaproteobacteria bacterium]|nr:MAG: hypothetical protein DRR06_16610 [Gammaproteobacteria bacterium]RLA44535.1 MAG: hypothetical protein DRR42_20345 [Gammaproteobacteria bacterium]
MNVEHNFNLLIVAFRQMEGEPRELASLLNTALKNTKWGTYQKHGITQKALIRVRANRAEKPKDGYWFKGVEAAHVHQKASWTLRLITEDIDNPYQFMLERDKCMLTTSEENDLEGTAHWSVITPLDPSLFGNGARPNILRRHPKFSDFIALLDTVN